MMRAQVYPAGFYPMYLRVQGGPNCGRDTFTQYRWTI